MYYMYFSLSKVKPIKLKLAEAQETKERRSTKNLL